MSTPAGTPPDLHAKSYLPVHQWRSYLSLLQENSQFRRLWLAGVVSQIGNWFNYIAIFVLLTQLTGSGHAVSWFLIAKFLPSVFLGPTAGVLADRLPRKGIMVFCDLTRVFVVLGFLAVNDPSRVWLVYVLALVQESLWSLYDPARRASVPTLCRPEELNVANALSGATWSVMLAIGAALGGLVTAHLGWRIAIIIDSLSFLVSALMLLGLTLPRPAAKTDAGRFSWRDYLGLTDILAGWHYIASHRRIAAILGVKSGWSLSGGILVMLTIFGEQVLSTNGQGGGSGLLYSVRGLGAALGPLLAWRLFGESEAAMHRAIAYAFVIAALAYTSLSFAGNFLEAAPLVFIGHLGGSVQWVFSTTLLQKNVPNHLLGRVLAAEMVLFATILSLSTYFTGLSIDRGIDPRTVMFSLGILFLVPALLWSCYLIFLNTKDHQPENID